MEFPENLQYEVVLRIANLDVIPPGIVEEIDTVLQREILSTEGLEAQQLLVRGLVNSLCSANGVDRVQLLLDGEVASSLGSVEISQPFSPIR